MEVSYVLITIKKIYDGEKTLGIYKYKHEKTAIEHYKRDKENLPSDGFIILMTIDNFQKRLLGKKHKLIKQTKGRKLKKKPRKAPQQRKAIDLIRSGELPGIERRK
jgi:hypothetical protein